MEQAPLTTSAVARALECSEAAVRKLEASGRLLATRTARGMRLFDPQEVARVAEARARERRG